MVRSRWMGLCVATFSVAGFMASAQANLLLDPGFEGVDASGGDVNTAAPEGAGPWLGWNNWVSPFGAYYTASAAHTGAQAAKTFSGANAGVYQFVDVTGQAGNAFTGSLWFLNNSADAMAASQLADVRVIFFDGANGTGNALGTFVAPAPFTGAATQDVWAQLTVAGDVPAGAVSAQFMGFFDNPTNAGGSMFVDDGSFTIVPEPASMALLAAGALALSLRRRRGGC